MNQETLKNWGSFLAFLVLAGISCWATEHSFHLLIAWMPEAFVWGVTVAFFFVSSYGTKLIVDALNKDLWIEHRRFKFWLGIVLIVVFWLLMSLPTNTHTFFYNHNIGNVAQEDMETTSKYLTQIRDRANTDSTYFAFHDLVNEKFKAVESEFNSIGAGVSGKRGNGLHVRNLLGKINPMLDKEISGLQIRFNDNPRAWNSTDQRILSDYENQKNVCLAQIKEVRYKATHAAAEEALEVSEKIKVMNDTIDKMVQSGNIYEDVITQTDAIVLSGYSLIKNNSRFVRFDNPTDRAVYTAANLETRIKRMLSVIDVWEDFFRGKYPKSFFGYILLSILVDVAAFIFFDFAFKRKE